MGEVSSRPRGGTKSDMKVLFVASVNYKGSGGHYHSLNHISQAMAEKIDVKICTIGDNESYILSKNPFFHQHFHLKNLEFLSFNKKFNLLLKNFNPDVIHFFDLKSYVIVELLVYPSNHKLVINKCGGGNPKWYPKVSNLIVFSEENYNWFKKDSKFKKTNIKIIPNRVNPKVLKFDFNSGIEKKASFCFVKIARIGETYLKSIEESIRLVEILNDEGHNVHLYIIGAIQNNEVANKLKNKINSELITLLTDVKYTRKASDMLYLADAVTATGRGIMEATYLGLPILTSAHNSDLPILVDHSNFKSFFKTNFSQRNEASKIDLKDNLKKVKRMINNTEYKNELKLNSIYFFNNFFNTDQGITKYLKFYEQIEISKNKISYFHSIDMKIRVLLKMLWKSYN